MSAFSALLQRVRPDNFTLALLATVGVATILPCTGRAAAVAGDVTAVAIGALFFLHGAKLPREAIVAGLTHWRLHLLVLCCTFVMFPVLGLLMKPLALAMLTPELYLGMLFLCMLPSTVQSSIAFTAMARGNVPAAVCSASASNFAGIFLTPLLVSALVVQGGGSRSALDAVVAITVQLLLPFIAGQLLRPWIGAWVDRHKPKLKYIDQGSILMVVYTAFSAAVEEGIWRQLGAASLLALVFVCCLLLAAVLWLTAYASRRLGFSREDAITIVFCGSKKSLASGVPMAKVLFATSSLGMIILPLMLFHQIQLMVCAVLAQRYSREPEAAR
ncbi:bile acid:sodium symporter family protein [Pseudoduganella namucuonensis]|uniref:Solute carrier family 10 (Sodium/bile acid cotransporter), member 7 n=1 Tax=Pseudoduganella namucuonensis TaxID=1035707 RepID=A0A1I7IVK2_9BURK|nr:bile acid:sodium symporter family protein [Pseudoduganella namucuonensis]SFU76960.1 solute carrier family 10 (sodium/bile acid cotransporter), member 7 [Pseudoduganella namucuonensis]